MTYALPINSTGTYAGLMQWANVTTDGYMGIGILLIVFSVVFFGTKRFNAQPAHATLAALTTTWMVCGALTIAGIVPTSYFIILLCAVGLSYFRAYHS